MHIKFYSQHDIVCVALSESLGYIGRGTFDELFDYLVPQGGCALGDFVEVPFGKRKLIGVVWGDGGAQVSPDRLRVIERVLDIARMKDELRLFIRKGADYTLTPLPSMLRLAMRLPDLGKVAINQSVYQLTDQFYSYLLDEKALPVDESRASALQTGADTSQTLLQITRQNITPARQRVVDALVDGGNQPMTLTELARLARCSVSVIKGMIRPGLVGVAVAPKDQPYPVLCPDSAPVRLEGDQIAAAAVLKDMVSKGVYAPVLLKGVTGSGKTEVYLEAIAQCLKSGRQALVLIPEIALTMAFLQRVEKRFGAPPAEWHSAISAPERRRLWHMVAAGKASLVVGARSALFLPFQNLGLIVVDEEHDSSYKQEDGVFYNARDMAVLRASITGCPVILASATPSLESLVNAKNGKYERLNLGARFGAAQLPDIRAIDMREMKLASDRWISPPLAHEIEKRIERKEQSLLFLNRRGYAPTTLCRACGNPLVCHNCDTNMVEHRFEKSLMCHQCGAKRPIPTVCPSCHEEGRLAPVGPGVERLLEEVSALFPDAKTQLLSSDIFGSTSELKEKISAISAGGCDIIIGTQIVAKGHNFPKLTLVGVIDADISLYGSDLRAAERTFQLITQVSGRAGRVVLGDKSHGGLALLQTYQPEHPVMRALLTGNEEAFWQTEAEMREMANTPPYGRFVAIICSSSDMNVLNGYAKSLALSGDIFHQIGAHLYGPVSAPIARLRGRYRVRFLIQARKNVFIQKAVSAWIASVKCPSKVRVSIDIDPQSFL